MAELKEMLLQEQVRLENILHGAEERLKNSPQGTLRISFREKWVQYYHCVPGGKKNGTYLPKAREKLIHPVEPVWEQQLEFWKSADYKRKEFPEDFPLFLRSRERGCGRNQKRFLRIIFTETGFPINMNVLYT